MSLQFLILAPRSLIAVPVAWAAIGGTGALALANSQPQRPVWEVFITPGTDPEKLTPSLSGNAAEARSSLTDWRVATDGTGVWLGEEGPAHNIGSSLVHLVQNLPGYSAGDPIRVHLFARGADSTSWTGADSPAVRRAASAELRDRIDATPPDSKLVLIGHSHGDTVNTSAVNGSARGADYLISLSSPGLVRPQPGKVSAHVSAYDPSDRVMTNAGDAGRWELPRSSPGASMLNPTYEIVLPPRSGNGFVSKVTNPVTTVTEPVVAHSRTIEPAVVVNEIVPALREQGIEPVGTLDQRPRVNTGQGRTENVAADSSTEVLERLLGPHIIGTIEPSPEAGSSEASGEDGRPDHHGVPADPSRSPTATPTETHADGRPEPGAALNPAHPGTPGPSPEPGPSSSNAPGPRPLVKNSSDTAPRPWQRSAPGEKVTAGSESSSTPPNAGNDKPSNPRAPLDDLIDAMSESAGGSGTGQQRHHEVGLPGGGLNTATDPFHNPALAQAAAAIPDVRFLREFQAIIDAADGSPREPDAEAPRAQTDQSEPQVVTDEEVERRKREYLAKTKAEEEARESGVKPDKATVEKRKRACLANRTRRQSAGEPERSLPPVDQRPAPVPDTVVVPPSDCRTVWEKGDPDNRFDDYELCPCCQAKWVWADGGGMQHKPHCPTQRP